MERDVPAVLFRYLVQLDDRRRLLFQARHAFLSGASKKRMKHAPAAATAADTAATSARHGAPAAAVRSIRKIGQTSAAPACASTSLHAVPSVKNASCSVRACETPP